MNIRETMQVYNEARQRKMRYLSRRWIVSMVAVDVYAIWERCAERRVVAGLNHHPQQFLTANGIRSLKRVPLTLATVLIRTGTRYFDFARPPS